MNKKYLKVMFGLNSGANKDLSYKINEINISNNWNPKTIDPKEMGGFNFSVEDKILRWLVRGDTLYDVIIPEDAEIVDCPNESSPHGVFRTNKIILSNPRYVTDEIAMGLYEKSDLPEKSYYKALAGLSIRGYINTCKQLINDRVNKNNIKMVLEEMSDFVRPENINGESDTKTYNEVMNILNKIANN